MTVEYSVQMASLKPLDGIHKILFRWTGSVYKLLWLEFIIYAVIYHIIQAVYNYALTVQQQLVFNQIHAYCSQSAESVPISFFLGFYVTLVIGRWWQQYLAIPWPDSLLGVLSANMRSNDENSKRIRFHIARYVLATFALYMMDISPPVRERYPSRRSLVHVDLLTKDELEILVEKERQAGFAMNHLPIIWASELVTEALEKNLLVDPLTSTVLIEKLDSFRGSLGSLVCYGLVSVPLAYTQTVVFAVYTYFGAMLIGGQFIVANAILSSPDSPPATSPINFTNYLPIVLYLQYVFYMGCLRVAQSLFNPFGTDDQDFDMMGYLERNIMVVLVTLQQDVDSKPAVLKKESCDQSFDLCKSLARKHSKQTSEQDYMCGEERIEMQSEP